jgi:hypothetical protein
LTSSFNRIGIVGPCHIKHRLQIPGPADRNRLAHFQHVVFADFTGNFPDMASVHVDDLVLELL